MQSIKHITLLLLGLWSVVIFQSCSEDTFENIEVTAPSNLQFTILNDGEPGLMKITPTAEGASKFSVDFGDDTDSEELTIGEATTHQYAEGQYTIKVIAYNISGQSVEATQTIDIAFDPPMDLVVDIVIDPVNTNVVSVTPSAVNAMTFDIYFGDTVDEEPTIIMAGSTANHSYTEEGEYEIKVIARSGSVTTLEYRETVIIFIPAAQLSLPIDFENPDIDYAFVSFGNAQLNVDSNPDMNNNNSARVGKLTKAAGAEVWAGGLLSLPNPIDFSTETTINMDVWSPKQGATVLLKLENGSDNTIFHEVMTPTTTSNQWETLSFDFSSIDQSNQYHTVVVFMDFGVVGDDSEYYFDNITQGEGGGNTGGGDDKVTLPLDFESTTITYGFTSFGNASADVLDNPDPTGNNVSNKVAHINKAAGAEVWAGAFIDITDGIDFTPGTTLTFNSWSPKSDAQILVKIEDSMDSDLFIELPTFTTAAGEWETLSIDFSSIDANVVYDRIVVFYDFGVAGEGEDYYFDDIRFE